MKFTSYASTFKKLVSIAALGIVAVAAHAETYALCLGINDYPEVKDKEGKVVDQDLKGCVNDAKAMKDVFIKKYGVKAANIKSLYDKEVTLEKFLDGIKWLASTAKAGDQVVFVYSGHGGQVDDKEEQDGKEEVIVLADMQLVPGDFFGEFAKLLNVNGINSTFMFDSCYSGGMSRDPGAKYQVRQKWMNLSALNVQKSIKAMPAVESRLMAVRPKQVGPTQTQGESVFLFASKEGNTSSDISGLEGFEPHGLFTMLVLAMLEDQPKVAVKDMYDAIDAVLESINSKLKEKDPNAKGFTQGPNFETSATRASKPILLGG